MRFTVLVVVPWLSAAADHSLTFIGFPTTPLFLGTKYPIEVRRTNNETHGDAVRVTPFTKCGCIQFRPPVIDIEAATPSTSFIIEAMNPPADGSSQVKISYGIEASSAFSDPCPPEIVQSGHAPRFCMITVNPFRMQSGHKGFIGIGFVLIVNVAVWIVCIIYFILWKTIRCSDQPGLFIRDPRTKNGPPGKGTWTGGGQLYQYITHGEYCTFTERIRTFFATPCDGAQVSALVGPDAVLYLRMQKDAIWLMLALSVVGLFVTMPVNVVQAKHKGILGFEGTTIKHVPRGSSVLWVHVGFIYVCTGCVAFYLRRLFQQMLHDREVAHPWAIVSLHTMFITDGPPPTATSNRLLCHLRHMFPGDVLDAVTVPSLGGYITQYNAWQEKVRELERARALKRKAADGTIPIFVQVCPGGPCCCSPSEVLRVYCGWCCQSRQVNPSLDGVTAGTEAEMRTLMGRKSVADSVRLEQEVATAEHATMIAREDLVCNGRALVTFRTREARQKCIDLLPYNGDRMIKLLAQGKSLTGARAARTSILNGNLLARAEEVGVQDPEELVEEARQMRMMDWEIDAAIEPDDIDWENMSQPQRWRVPTFIAVNFLVIILVVLFSSPVAVISAVKQISTGFSEGTGKKEADSSPLPRPVTVWLHEVSKMDPKVAALLFQFLPPLYMIIVNYLLLMSLYYAARVEPHYTETGKMLSTLKKAFTYLIFSTLLLPCLGVASVTVLVHHAFIDNTDQYHTFVEAISSFFVSACGEFFINYVCQRTWIGTAVELMRFGQLWGLQPILDTRAVTEREKQEADEPWPFYYGWEYGMMLSVFVVILVSSTMVPLLLPFGVFYFAVKTGIDKYNFLYVWPYHAGTGLLALTAMHCLGIGLLIMQFCMLGFFLYWGTTWQFILVAILFAVTAMWSANWILSAPWVALLRKADDKRPAVFPFHEGIESPRFYNPLAQDGDDKTV